MPAPLLLCRLVDSALRKFVSVAELLVSPSAPIMFLKSVCSVESAVLLELPVVDVELDEASCWIRLCRLDSRPAGPPLMPEVEVVPVLLSLLLCACSAAIRLCRKALTAWSALVLEDEEEIEDEVDDVPAVEVPELDELPMPIDESASEIAPSNPPPPPGGGGGGAPTELLLSVPLVPASWLNCESK